MKSLVSTIINLGGLGAGPLQLTWAAKGAEQIIREAWGARQCIAGSCVECGSRIKKGEKQKEKETARERKREREIGGEIETERRVRMCSVVGFGQMWILGKGKENGGERERERAGEREREREKERERGENQRERESTLDVFRSWVWADVDLS